MKILNCLLILIVLATIIGLMNCGPTEPTPEPPPLTELEKLPPATNQGLNTFGCLINGKAVVKSLQRFGPANYTLGVFEFSESFRTDDFHVHFFFELVHSDLKTGQYTLNDTTLISTIRHYLFYNRDGGVIPDEYNGLGYIRVGNFKTGYNYYSNEEYGESKLTITHLDKVKYIVSGTFEFTVVAPDADTLKVTDGRFDVEYIPY